MSHSEKEFRATSLPSGLGRFAHPQSRLSSLNNARPPRSSMSSPCLPPIFTKFSPPFVSSPERPRDACIIKHGQLRRDEQTRTDHGRACRATSGLFSERQDRFPKSPDGRTTERAAWIYDRAVSSLTMKSTVQDPDRPARTRIFSPRRPAPETPRSYD